MGFPVGVALAIDPSSVSSRCGARAESDGGDGEAVGLCVWVTGGPAGQGRRGRIERGGRGRGRGRLRVHAPRRMIGKTEDRTEYRVLVDESFFNKVEEESWTPALLEMCVCH